MPLPGSRCSCVQTLATFSQVLIAVAPQSSVAYMLCKHPQKMQNNEGCHKKHHSGKWQPVYRQVTS